jgi:Glycolipid transfer protein (GLTP)
MLGNIKKIRDRQLAAPLDSSTLQSLVKSELSTKKHTATEGLLWLTRGLDFTAQALREDVKSGGSQELSLSFRSAYKGTLAPHHSFLVKPIFSAAMSATPYRKDFYAKMGGQGTDPVKVDEALKNWLGALEERVKILNRFTTSKEAKW